MFITRDLYFILLDVGVGGMVDVRWTVPSGWIWLGVALIGVVELLWPKHRRQVLLSGKIATASAKTHPVMLRTRQNGGKPVIVLPDCFEDDDG